MSHSKKFHCVVRWFSGGLWQSCCLLLFAHPVWGEYKVILRDGTKIEATAKPVSMEGQYRFTDQKGQFRTIPLTQIDLRATEEANKTTFESNQKKVTRVLTNEDIAATSTIAGPPPNNGQASAETLESETALPKKKPGTLPISDQRAEAYWRQRSRDIRAQLERVEKAIAELDAKMRSGQSDGLKIGFDTYTPVIHANFGDEMKSLQEEKAKVQKKMEDLEEEARKAGAQPGWLR